MKIYAVLSTNEYSNSTSDIQVHGAFQTYSDADKKRDEVQRKLDKSTSLGWQVWVQESTLYTFLENS